MCILANSPMGFFFFSNFILARNIERLHKQRLKHNAERHGFVKTSCAPEGQPPTYSIGSSPAEAPPAWPGPLPAPRLETFPFTTLGFM